MKSLPFPSLIQLGALSALAYACYQLYLAIQLFNSLPAALMNHSALMGLHSFFILVALTFTQKAALNNHTPT